MMMRLKLRNKKSLLALMSHFSAHELRNEIQLDARSS